jgi:hypothetical protein
MSGLRRVQTCAALSIGLSAPMHLGDDVIHFSGGESPAGGRVDVNALGILM